MKSIINIWKLLRLLVFLTATQPVLVAQDVMDTVVHIYEVRVFAQTSPEEKGLVTSEIDSIELSNNPAEDLSTLLSNNSFIYMRSYGHGGLSTVSFRGTAASHTKVYWNDIEINDPAAGQTDFSLIPVSFIDEVKIYHGGSSLQKGSGAIGGSIHLNALPVWEDEVRSTLYQKSGSFNTHYSFAGISGAKRNVSFRIRAFRRMSDNDFEYLNTSNGLWNRERLKYASSLKKGGQTDLFIKSNGKGIFSFHGWYQDSDRNFAPVMSYMGPARKENQQDRTYRFAGKWKYYGNKLISRITAGISANELNYFLGMNEPRTVIYQTRSNSSSLQLRYDGEANLSSSTKLKILGELSHMKAHYDDLKKETDFNAKRPEAGMSLSLHHKFDFPVAIYTLLRKDIYGDKISPFMPAAGIEYSPSILSGLSFKTNLSRNYHYPDLNDLFWIPGGNPDLEPEVGYSSDVSVNYRLMMNEHELKTSLTGYYSSIDNWILWKPGEYGFWKAENLARVNSHGIEYQVNTDIKLNRLKFYLAGTYAYTRTVNREKEIQGDASYGKQLIYLPVHKANMNFFVQRKYFRIAYDLYAAGKRFVTTDNDPSQALDPYVLHDIKISGNFSFHDFQFESGLEVKNLLNTDYQVIKSRPMPGRNYGIWLKVMF